MAIEFRTFGTATLSDESGQEVTSLLRQPKRVALLTFLCLAHPRGRQRRDVIAALLWPDLDQVHARTALRKAVFGLREALGPEVVLSSGDEEVRIDPTKFWCDAWAFEEALDVGRLKEALELYRGELLEGFYAKDVAPEFEERLARERGRLRSRAYGGAWSLAGAAEEAGQTREALEWSNRAGELMLDDEVAVRRLIEQHARLGDRAGALAIYERHATRLREEFDAEPDPQTQALLGAIRSHAVRTTKAPTAVGSGRPSSPEFVPILEPEAEPAPPRSRFSMALTTSVAVVVLTAVLYVLYGWVRAAPEGSGAPANSVAVLGFENLSDGDADEYLSYGLTDETITRLGRLPDFTVASRPAVRRFEGSTGDPAEIGRALGVEYLVSGTLRRDGDRIRVRAEMLRAVDGIHVWGESYEIAEDDIFAVEDSIARAVAFTIGGQLAPDQERLLTSHPTDNPKAYQHYIRGNYFLSQRNPTAVARAIAEYHTAARVDPNFAGALAKAGMGYTLFLDWEWDYEGVSRDSLFELGFGAADQALRNDSLSAEAWRVRGMLNMLRSPRTFAGAAASFARALEIEHTNAGALHSFAVMEARLGNDTAAVELLHRALASEPGRPISLFVLFEVEYRERHYEESLAWLDSTLTVDPGFYFGYALRGLNRLRLGDVDGARQDGQTSVRFSAGIAVPGSAVLALAEVQQGDSSAARLRLDRLDRQVAARGGASAQEALWLAMVDVGLGNYSAALDRLEAIPDRTAEFWFWLRLPEFDPIRNEPRFERLFEDSRPRPDMGQRQVATA